MTQPTKNSNMIALLKIAVIVLVLMGFFLYLTNISGLLFESIPEENDEVLLLRDAREHIKECLPISPSNQFYVDPLKAQEARSELLREVNSFVESSRQMEHSPSSHELLHVYERYYDEVGANGIFDVFAMVSKELESHASHSVGEFLADKANGQYLDMVEILACDVSIGAALHGLIWTALSNETDETIYDKSRELCGFRTVKGMSFVGSACLHGVGHGFFMKYGNNPIRSYDRCNLFSDREMAYRCGSGVSMSVRETRQKPRFWTECKMTPMPAFCYENISPAFDCAELEKTDVSDNNKIGCAWAFGRHQHNSTGCDDTFLEPFPTDFERNMYKSCLAGMFSKRPTSCSPFKADDEIHELCEGSNKYHRDKSTAYDKDPESNKLTFFNHLILDLYIETTNGLCCLF